MARLRRFVFTCPCGKAAIEWMAETTEIAKENFAAFAQVHHQATCRQCKRKLAEFRDRALN